MIKACHAVQYIGEEPFACMYYAPADCAMAYTLAEKLSAKGYRIWYACVNEQEDHFQEDDQLLHEMISRCALVMALYSVEAASRHDFRSAITDAVLNGREILPVFLDEVELSIGMRLQIAHAQRVNWFSAEDEIDAMTENRTMRICRGNPDASVKIEIREKKIEEKALTEKKFKWPISQVVSEEELLAMQKRCGMLMEEKPEEKHEDAQQETPEEEPCEKREEEALMETPEETQPEEKKPEEKPVERRQTKEIRTEVIAHSPVRTQLIEQNESGRRGDTELIEETCSMLIRMSTGECFRIRNGMITVGRVSSCDICIPEKTISAKHLEIASVPGSNGVYQNIIRDCDSSNGTWINGTMLDKGKAVRVEDHAMIELGRRERCLALFGDLAEKFGCRKSIASLTCRETGEERAVIQDEWVLGRCQPWEKHTFDDATISWNHAMIRYEKEAYWIKDMKSSNGTMVNGDKIDSSRLVRLSDGDEIKMGYRHFVFHVTELRGMADERK